MSGPLQLSILELLGGKRWDGGSCQSKVDGGGHGLYVVWLLMPKSRMVFQEWWHEGVSHLSDWVLVAALGFVARDFPDISTQQIKSLAGSSSARTSGSRTIDPTGPQWRHTGVQPNN